MKNVSIFISLFPDISIKSTKLHFQSSRKTSLTASFFFSKVTSKYQETAAVVNDIRIVHFFDIF